jgi:hypothetical protein
MKQASDYVDVYQTQRIKRAIIDHAVSGNNTIVSAVTAKKIRVYAVVLVSAGTMTVRFTSGAGGTNLTGDMTTAAGTGFSSDFCPVGHFETNAGQALVLNLSAATSSDGWIVYAEV